MNALEDDEFCYDPVFEFDAPQWCDLLRDSLEEADESWFARLHLDHEAAFMMTFMTSNMLQHRINNISLEVMMSRQSNGDPDASPKRGITLREDKGPTQYNKDQFLVSTLADDIDEDLNSFISPPKSWDESSNFGQNQQASSPFKPKLKRFGLSGPARRGESKTDTEFTSERDKENGYPEDKPRVLRPTVPLSTTTTSTPSFSHSAAPNKQTIFSPPVRLAGSEESVLASLSTMPSASSACPSSPSGSIYSPPVRRKPTRGLRYTTSAARISSLAMLSSLPEEEDNMCNGSTGLIASSPLAKGTVARVPFGSNNNYYNSNNVLFSSDVKGDANHKKAAPLRKSTLSTASVLALAAESEPPQPARKKVGLPKASSSSAPSLLAIDSHLEDYCSNDDEDYNIHHNSTRTHKTKTTTASTAKSRSKTTKPSSTTKATTTTTTTTNKRPTSRTRGDLQVTKAPPVTATKKAVPNKATIRRRRTGFPTNLDAEDEGDSELKSLLDQHNRKFKTSKTTYQPRVHSYQDIAKWEKRNGQKWYDLSAAEREAANAEISLMKRVSAKHGT